MKSTFEKLIELFQELAPEEQKRVFEILETEEGQELLKKTE